MQLTEHISLPSVLRHYSGSKGLHARSIVLCIRKQRKRELPVWYLEDLPKHENEHFSPAVHLTFAILKRVYEPPVCHLWRELLSADSRDPGHKLTNQNIIIPHLPRPFTVSRASFPGSLYITGFPSEIGVYRREGKGRRCHNLFNFLPYYSYFTPG